MALRVAHVHVPRRRVHRDVIAISHLRNAVEKEKEKEKGKEIRHRRVIRTTAPGYIRFPAIVTVFTDCDTTQLSRIKGKFYSIEIAGRRGADTETRQQKALFAPFSKKLI